MPEKGHLLERSAGRSVSSAIYRALMGGAEVRFQAHRYRCEAMGARSGRIHYFRSILKVGDTEGYDFAMMESLFTEAGLTWDNYSEDEALSRLGDEYVMAYYTIADSSMRVQYKSKPRPELRAPFEAEIKRWAARHGLTVHVEADAFYASD